MDQQLSTEEETERKNPVIEHRIKITGREQKLVRGSRLSMATHLMLILSLILCPLLLNYLTAEGELGSNSCLNSHVPCGSFKRLFNELFDRTLSTC